MWRRRQWRARLSLSGPYLRSAIHGSFDGLITTFTTICASIGVELTVAIIVVMTTANLIGDGLSLAVSDVISTGVARRYALSQYEQVRDAVRTDRDAVVARVAEQVGDDTALDALPDHTLVQLRAAAVVDAAPLAVVLRRTSIDWRMFAKQGAVTATSFIVFGSMPIVALYVGDSLTSGYRVRGGFALSALVTIVLLFAIGVFNAHYLRVSPLTGGALMLVTGAPTTLIVFGLSAAINHLMPASLRSAQTCDLSNYFIRAAER